MHRSDNDRVPPAANQGHSNVTDGDDLSLTGPLRVTGEVFVDLTDVSVDKARGRAYFAVYESPPGATVVLYVGPLTVNYDVVRMVAEFGRHVEIKVSGHAPAVARWIDALRGNGEVIL